MNPPQLILIGPPNTGKTSLFNWLTGFNNKVINYPGSTVSLSKGQLLKKYAYSASVIDSPGTYSLSKPQSEDEKISLKILSQSTPKPLVILLLDTTKLEIQLPLFFELKSKALPVVIALSMSDLLEKKFRPDSKKLSQILETPVIPIQTKTGEGVLQLIETVKSYDFSKIKKPNKMNKENRLSILNHCKKIVQSSLKNIPSSQKSFSYEKENLFLSHKWDRFFLQPKMGLIFFAMIMFLLFSSIFWLATPFMTAIDSFFSFLMAHSFQWLSFSPLLADLTSNGIIGGFAAVTIFLPQIFILFAGIAFLEDSGYLARAVALMDGPLSKIGLSGKAFVPFLSGYACAIPAILSAKSLSNKKEKQMVFFTIPFMSCSARLPVYALLLSFLFYKDSLWKPGLFLTVIYIASFLIGAVAVFVLNKILKPDKTDPFLLDLPVYRSPSFLKIVNQAFKQSQHYLVKAGPAIFVVSLGLWLLSHFPYSAGLSDSEQMSQSYAGQIGQFLEPVFQLMGLDWRVGICLILAFAAREVFVSSLLVIFMITKTSDLSVMDSLLETMKTAVDTQGALVFSTPSVCALIVFFMISLQCLSTSALVYKESASLKFTITQFMTLNLLAGLIAVACYQGLSLIL